MDSTPHIDSHGNIDYGFTWSEAAQDYVPRAGAVAAERRAMGDCEHQAARAEWLARPENRA